MKKLWGAAVRRWRYTSWVPTRPPSTLAEKPSNLIHFPGRPTVDETPRQRRGDLLRWANR